MYAELRHWAEFFYDHCHHDKWQFSVFRVANYLNFVTVKLLFSILFSSLVFLSGTKNLIFLVDYSLNADYYETVCENRSRPEMECHGKCQITKDAQKNSESLSFNHFSFDFYPLENIELSLPYRESVNGLAAVGHPLTLWNALLLNVPNPPPNCWNLNS